MGRPNSTSECQAALANSQQLERAGNPGIREAETPGKNDVGSGGFVFGSGVVLRWVVGRFPFLSLFLLGRVVLFFLFFFIVLYFKVLFGIVAFLVGG